MRKILGFLTLLVLTAGSAAAQTNTLQIDNPRETARVKLGPFYVSPYVVLTEMGVDTNVFNANGERQSDFMLFVVPQARVWLPVSRRALIKTNVGTGLAWYRELASERSVNPQFASHAEIYFRRFTLLGNGSFVHSRQRPTFELDLRSRRREVAFGGGIDVRLAPKLTMQLGAQRTDVEFDGDAVFEGTSLQTTLNREGAEANAGLRYQWTSLTAFTVHASRTADTFDLSPERDNASLRATAGVEFRPRALINGFARLGLRRLTPDDKISLEPFSGMVADVGLSYTLLGATTIGVSHQRDLAYSFERLQPYYVNNSFGTRVRRAIGPRFDAVVLAERHQYAYRNLRVLPGSDDLELVPAERRVDTTMNFGGSFGYRVGREGRIGFGATYTQRTSAARKHREFEGWRIGLTGNYGQ